MKGLRDAIEQGEGGANVQVPADLSIYVDTVGPEQAIDLFMELGGAMYYFAGNPTDASRAAAIIGAEAVQTISQHFRGGPRVRVPLAKPWISRYLYAEGWTISAIARRLHISDVTVRKYIRKREVQLGLFDN